LFVTSLQQMTHFLNEYWDHETDRLNQSRTPWSGGSGVFTQGLISREAALTAGLVCLAAGAVAAAWLGLGYGAGPGVWALFMLIFLGAYFYSSPPLNLASTGFGELSASVVVAGLVPALGHMLQAGRPSLLVLLATAPLVVLHFAMLLAFEFPDFLADEAAGKRTLLVRVGRRVGAQVHNAALAAALLLTATGTFAGLPARVAVGGILVAPLLVLQMVQLRRLQWGLELPFSRLTLVAVLTFVLAAYFTAFSFWVIGNRA
jgi:1,4-dihydroxy-2-naphthoate octaprenyltransferase